MNVYQISHTIDMKALRAGLEAVCPGIPNEIIQRCVDFAAERVKEDVSPRRLHGFAEKIYKVHMEETKRRAVFPHVVRGTLQIYGPHKASLKKHFGVIQQAARTQATKDAANWSYTFDSPGFCFKHETDAVLFKLLVGNDLK
jgi:hypothetical protein